MTTKEEKARRMELRKNAGNRTVEHKVARGPGPAYLVAHACFRCRKSFKIAPRDDAPLCPDCGLEIHWMGRSFKAPKADDMRQWKKVQLLYAHGFRFVGTGAHPPLPDRLQDVEAFLRENPEHVLKIADPIQALKPT